MTEHAKRLEPTDLSPIATRLFEAEELSMLLHRYIGRELVQRGILATTPTRALMCYHMMGKRIRTSEIRRFAYMGTNPSYNVAKLVKHGLVTQETSKEDRRAVILQLTADGVALGQAVSEMLAALQVDYERSVLSALPFMRRMYR